MTLQIVVFTNIQQTSRVTQELTHPVESFWPLLEGNGGRMGVIKRGYTHIFTAFSDEDRTILVFGPYQLTPSHYTLTDLMRAAQVHNIGTNMQSLGGGEFYVTHDSSERSVVFSTGYRISYEPKLISLLQSGNISSLLGSIIVCKGEWKF